MDPSSQPAPEATPEDTTVTDNQELAESAPTDTGLTHPETPAAPEEAVISPEPVLRTPEPIANPVTAPPAPTVMSSSDTTNAPVVSAAPPTMVSGSSKKPRRKLLALVAVVIVVLLAGGYTFAFYLPNTPGRVYSSSMGNTGKALDKLVDYVQTEDKASYKGASFDGTVKYKSSSVSFDSTLTGAFDKDSNGKLQFKADIEGENITANVVSTKAAGNTSPDLYVQVSGVKNFLDGAGMGDFDSLDGQWISIDHTLLDTYAASLKDSLGGAAGGNVTNAAGIPTVAQLNDAISKVQTVNKQYIFTTDASKAVLTNEKFVAKETKNGRSQDHYKVGYNKVHLQAYVAALKTALDSSQLNDWSKKANDGKSLSEALDFTSLQKSIQNAKSGYTLDLWADTKTKLVSSVQFTDASDNSKLTIGQNYTGGSVYPLTISVSDSADSNGSFGLNVDTKTHKYVLNFTATPGTKSADSTTVTGNLTITPNNNGVKVSAPSGAKSINDVLDEFGLGGLLSNPTTDQTSNASFDDNSPFTLTQ